MAKAEQRIDDGAGILSYSKITTANRCGMAYKFQYVDQIKPERVGSALRFGNSVHDGVDRWYGERDDTFGHQERDLPELIEQRWFELLPKNIKTKTAKVLEAKKDADAVKEVILLKRPELKAPTQTKEYQTAAPVIAFNKQLEALQRMTDDCPTMRWANNNNAFRDLVEMQRQAQGLIARWHHLPRPPVVEEKFTIAISGIPVRGVIDQIRTDPDHNGELAQVPVLDMKTGQNLLSQQEAFIQAYIYYKAAHELDMPTPTHVEFLHTRLGKLQQVHIDLKKHDKLAKTIFDSVLRKMNAAPEELAPEYGFWCNRCDYRDLCDKQLSLWQTENGVVVVPE